MNDQEFLDKHELLALLKTPAMRADLSLRQKNADAVFDDTKEYPDETAKTLGEIAKAYYEKALRELP